jgi:hypothetical protein
LVFSIICSALTVLMAATIVEPNSRVKALGFFAFGLQVISTLSLVLFSTWYVRSILINSLRWELRKLLAFVSVGISVSLIASVITAASIGWTTVISHGHPTLGMKNTSHVIFLAWCIEWGASVLTQGLFYGYLIRWTVQRQVTRAHYRFSRDLGSLGNSPEMQEARRPQTAETNQSGVSRDQVPSSPPRTPTSSDAFSSFRSSLSRTKLITRQLPFPRGSNNSSLDLPIRDRGSQDEAFDSWDTSSVGPQIREAVHQSSPNSIRAAPLEPIPGSRPDSPANALDGPFLPESPHQSSASLPPSTLDGSFLAQSPHQSSASLSSIPSSPINFSRPTSRHRTPSVDDHIHPLFRTNSPTPPPTATPGTIVTAAPNAGQVISGRTLSRMRSGSLPSTSSPLANKQQTNDSQEVPPSPSPAIPGFVLSAGTRTSLVGYKRRNLKSTSEEEEEANPPFF